MKKSIVVLLVLGLVAAAFSAPAFAKKKKAPTTSVTMTGTYRAPAPLIFGPSCSQTEAIGCVSIVSPGTSITGAKVTDQTGQPVFVVISSKRGDNRRDKFHGTFCGELKKPIDVPAGTDLHFWVGVTLYSPRGSGPGIPVPVDCVPAAGTSGKIDVTFAGVSS